MTNKKWIDQHFQPAPTADEARLQFEATQRQMRRRRMRPYVIATQILVVSLFAGAAGIIASDLLGWTHTGMGQQAKTWTLSLLPKPSAVAERRTAQPEPSTPTNEDVSDVPPPTTSAPPNTPAGSTQERTATVNAALLRERVSHLDTGIDLMRRELMDADQQSKHPAWQISMRPRGGRPKPWTAAERINEMEIFAGENPNMSAIDRNKLASVYADAVADLSNARIRLKELQDKQQSLSARITKAVNDKNALTSQTASNP